MRMDLSKIEKLLERYWNCVTTVEEEEELREFFKSNEVPSELTESAKLFKYFDLQRSAKLDTKFENEVIKKIKDQKNPVVKSIGLNFSNYMKIAAVVAGIITASVIFRLEFWDADKPQLLVEDTFQTPEEAYEETKKAFLLIAEKMNSGRVQTTKIGALNQAEQKIKKEEK